MCLPPGAAASGGDMQEQEAASGFGGQPGGLDARHTAKGVMF